MIDFLCIWYKKSTLGHFWMYFVIERSDFKAKKRQKSAPCMQKHGSIYSVGQKIIFIWTNKYFQGGLFLQSCHWKPTLRYRSDLITCQVHPYGKTVETQVHINLTRAMLLLLVISMYYFQLEKSYTT